jgi:RHS repeat-associated protein
MEYTLKDHLGNARVTFADLNGDATVDQTEILQTNHYYPFGMRHEGNDVPQQGTVNAYQYNGKELNSDFGLDWLDYGARWYDASIARWSAVDLLAEGFVNQSPYDYVFNNPLSWTDPDGRAPALYTNFSAGKSAEIVADQEERTEECRDRQKQKVAGGANRAIAMHNNALALASSAKNAISKSNPGTEKPNKDEERKDLTTKYVQTQTHVTLTAHYGFKKHHLITATYYQNWELKGSYYVPKRDGNGEARDRDGWQDISKTGDYLTAGVSFGYVTAYYSEEEFFQNFFYEVGGTPKNYTTGIGRGWLIAESSEEKTANSKTMRGELVFDHAAVFKNDVGSYLTVSIDKKRFTSSFMHTSNIKITAEVKMSRVYSNVYQGGYKWTRK